MPGAHDLPPTMSHAEREALAGELIGAAVDLASPTFRTRVRGAIVDETMSTFHVRLADGSRTVVVPKTGLTGTIVLGSGELPLSGEALRVRPEDRTKRLLSGGPRRYR